MAQKHDISIIEQPMTVATTEQGPQKRYRRLRFPSFNADVWAEKNPLLQKGELGHEKDTGRFKVGDGITYWEDLPYNSVGDKGDKGDNAIINGYNIINIVEGRNISVEQEGDTLIISAKGEASGSYNKEEIDNKFAVVNSSIDANADAIAKTRNDYEVADQEIRADMNEKDAELEHMITEHATELSTLRGNQASLGDQVAGIEAKIPESASETNPLITKQQLLDEVMDIREDMGNADGELQTQITAQASAITANFEELSTRIDATNERIDTENERIDTANEQINTKQDVATAINYGHVTNCITEIPQDIKLELADGAITLKANSKLYQPNGSGVFTPIVMSADKARSDFSAFGSGTYLLFYSQSYGGLIAKNINNCVSGATDTSTATSHTWYDTTNNKIKTYENGSYTLDDLTLPLCVFENTYGTGATSIKNVFNGFGYIGYTIFVLPGVKGLVPNGRNTDGTLKNTTRTTTAVSVYTASPVVNDYEYQLVYNGSLVPFYSHMTYNAEENINYNTNGTPSAWAIVGSLKFNNNTISEFNPKTTFHAADYNDTGFIAHQSMPSDNYFDLSLPAHGAYITVPADGYLVMSIEPGVSGQGIGLRNATAGDIGQIIYMGGTGRYLIHTHVSKGDSVQVFHYNSTPNMFRLVYANGSK